MHWNLNWDPHACAESTLTAVPSQPPACRSWIASLSQWCLTTASPVMQHDEMDFSPLMTGHQRNYCVTKTHWIWFLWRLLSSPKGRNLQILFDLPLWKNKPSFPCQASELHGEGHMELLICVLCHLSTSFEVFFHFVSLSSSFLSLEQKLFSYSASLSQVQTFCLFNKQCFLLRNHYFLELLWNISTYIEKAWSQIT